MAGCTISPLAFTMEVITRASKWVVAGERLKSGVRLPLIRAFMDDMTTMTTTAPCTRRLLEKLHENVSAVRMKFKPAKLRNISTVKGKPNNGFSLTESLFQLCQRSQSRAWEDGTTQV